MNTVVAGRTRTWIAWLGLCACGGGATPGQAEPAAATAPSPSPASHVAAMPSWSGEAWPDASARAEAIERELQRDASPPIEAADAQARVAVARTLARIGGADAAAALQRQLAAQPDPSPALIAAVGLLEPLPSEPGAAATPEGAFAALEQWLWTLYAVDEAPARMRATAFALARIGGRETQRRFAVELAAPDDDAGRRAAVLEAMGILCARRHALDAAALEGVAGAVGSDVDEVRRAGLYALGRCAAPSAEVFAGPERAAWIDRLAAAIADADDDVARLAWRALAAFGELPATIPAAILGDEPPPWLVEVEAVRALAAHDRGRAALIERLARLSPAQIAGVRTTVVWVALAGLRQAVDAEPKMVEPLAALARSLAETKPADARAAHERALVRCELELLAAIATGSVAALERCADGTEALPPWYGATLAVDALASMGRAEHARIRAEGLLERAGDPRAAVAAAAIAALADVEDPRVSSVLREALLRADAGVLAAATGAIAARSADRDRRDGAAVAPLQRLLQSADPIAALEARLSAIEALGALARSAPAPAGAAAPPGEDLAAPPRLDARGDEGRAWLERTVLPLATDPNDAVRRAAWLALAGHDALRERFAAAVPTRFPEGFAPPVHEAVAQRQGVVGLRVHTALGPFVVAFEDAPAPIAQGALAGLARAGYFDGLRFHRVVPGFVVQGGDPRGDGYGGPGWVMPCEWSELRYERGTVGIALAGKDTGGSQFFVTHTRQPHLDGRFTVIGRVIDGMDIVDRLLPQDPIVRVEPLEALP